MTNPNALQWFKRRRGWNPLTDPALLGLWVAPDATDNGTDLTIPNRVSGGPSLVANGAGRQSIAPTGLNNAPAILGTGSTKVLSCSLPGATGKTSSTVLFAGQLTAFSNYLWRFGVSDKCWFCITTVGAGYQVYKQSGTGIMTNTQVNKGLRYPRVVTSRFDDALANDIVSTRQQGLAGPPTYSGTDAAGALAAGSFYLASNSNAGLPITGHAYGAMVFSRYLTDAECTIAEQYMNGLMGQGFRLEIMWDGDSLVACSSVGGAMWRKRLEENYQTAAIADGAWWYFSNGWNSPSNVAFTNDYTPSGGGATVATMRTGWTTNGLGTSYVPDVLWITIGTNDIAVSLHSNATLSTNLLAALVDARARLPNAQIVVEQLFPRNDGFNAQVLDWNANYHGQLIIDANALGLNVTGKSTWPTYGTSIGGYTYLDGVHISNVNTNGIGDAAWAALKAFVGIT